jgi:hypothetical protein
VNHLHAIARHADQPLDVIAVADAEDDDVALLRLAPAGGEQLIARHEQRLHRARRDRKGRDDEGAQQQRQQGRADQHGRRGQATGGKRETAGGEHRRLFRHAAGEVKGTHPGARFAAGIAPHYGRREIRKAEE